jgi:hypothetical protein
MHHVVPTFGFVHCLLSSLSDTEDTQCDVDIAPSISMLWQQGHSGAVLADLYCDFLLWNYPKALLFSGLVVALWLKGERITVPTINVTRPGSRLGKQVRVALIPRILNSGEKYVQVRTVGKHTKQPNPI